MSRDGRPPGDAGTADTPETARDGGTADERATRSDGGATDDRAATSDGGAPVTDAAEGDDSPVSGDDSPADEADPPEDGADSPADEAELIVNERDTEEGLLVAVCDGDVLGETFEEGQVSLTVTEEFYAGDAVDAEGVVRSLSRATVANIVGTRAVEIAIEAGIVDEAQVLEVESTLHAQLVRLS